MTPYDIHRKSNPGRSHAIPCMVPTMPHLSNIISSSEREAAIYCEYHFDWLHLVAHPA